MTHPSLSEQAQNEERGEGFFSSEAEKLSHINKRIVRILRAIVPVIATLTFAFGGFATYEFSLMNQTTLIIPTRPGVQGRNQQLVRVKLALDDGLSMITRLDGTALYPPARDPISLGTDALLSITPKEVSVYDADRNLIKQIPEDKCNLRMSLDSSLKLFLCQQDPQYINRPGAVTVVDLRPVRQTFPELALNSLPASQRPRHAVILAEAAGVPWIVYRTDREEQLGIRLDQSGAGPVTLSNREERFSRALAEEALRWEVRRCALPPRKHRVPPMPLLPHLFFSGGDLYLSGQSTGTGSPTLLASLSVPSFLGFKPTIFVDDQTVDGRFVLVRINNRTYVLDLLEKRIDLLGDGWCARFL